MPRLIRRNPSVAACRALEQAGIGAVLARVLAARGITAPADIDTDLRGLPPTDRLLNADRMALILADAIAAQQRLLIVGDYDADGATAVAVGHLGLSRFGARVDYLVPRRLEYGYGLTPEIVRVAAQRRPDFIITVDNGIAAFDGIDEANRLGIPVLVTDHHLPADRLPAARCIVNPNQPGCDFPGKNLAGVGVMFYVLLALRAELRRRDAFTDGAGPNLAELLDVVALGTVADVVSLDRTNRILVAQGLRRIRAGRARPGIEALLQVAGRDRARTSIYDLGFVLGPRLNAAGRLDDMTEGVECLVTADPGRARDLASHLDRKNLERRELQADMQSQALDRLDGIEMVDRCSVTLFDADWHPGVVGLVASRLRERFHRPAICFARGPDGGLKGSGRSIRGLHLRDALDRVDRAHPGLIERFGGHAAAAGLSLAADRLPAFETAFEQTVRALLTPADLEDVLETDGGLTGDECALDTAEALAGQVWGQGFPPPVFDDVFGVVEQRVVGGEHLRLRLQRLDARGQTLPAILFGQSAPLPDRIQAAYRLEVNEWNGHCSAQLVVQHWLPG
ncbi:MAG: single-stranded-DNA-specific exonuclease RecJ [Burkholderiales bacterium]|nr:single-stranded-DNA-specific exonuclease RecJ [Burkholderiales bacterium]